MTIKFYATRDVPYGCFSNFAPYGFFIDDIFWRTAEHYFQAQKFRYPTAILSVGEQYRKIQKASTPKLAAQLGRTKDIPLHPHWEEIKVQVMYFALKEKFATHELIKEILLASGNEEIVENSPKDYYWGIGKNQTGENMLGKLLMQVRDELR